MKPSTLNAIAWVAIIVIIVSVLNMGLQLTGNATVNDSAVVNITVSSSAAINFTTDFFDFGVGTVDLGQSSATLYSNGTVTDGSWTVTPGKLILTNIGNEDVTLTLKSDKTAATFLSGTSPSFKYLIEDDIESGSCSDESGLWVEFQTSDTAACTNFLSAGSTDTIGIQLSLVVPSDGNSGTDPLTATITATGTYT